LGQVGEDFERLSVMKYTVLSVALAGLALSGCTGPIIMGTDAVVTVVTRPGAGPDADTGSQIPEHENWCYATMGETECFTHAQDVPPERLVNVDPQNRYPVTLQSYRDEIAGKHAAVPPEGTAEPVVLGSAASIEVEKRAIADDIKTP